MCVQKLCHHSNLTARLNLPHFPTLDLLLNTSNLTDDERRQELRRNHHLSASELKGIHQDHLGNVSIRCMEHRPKKDLKISSRRAASKTLLTPRMRKKRLQFALRYLHGSVDDKKNVMWSDEFIR